MKKIESFCVDHLKLLPGVYVSRKDKVEGNTVTTFDIRITRPNFEPVINNAALHAIEHLGATFFRNHKVLKHTTIYFGPMGCRTGFYLILSGDIESKDIVEYLKEMCEYIIEFVGDVPGANSVECGNYLDLNLDMAKYVMNKYYNEVLLNITDDKLVY